MDAASALPPWIAGSSSLSHAYSLAEQAHGSSHRPTDDRLFLDHVSEVATFLHEAAFGEGLVAVGLLHDAVERGAPSEEELRAEMGDQIAWLVMVLAEDASIDSFDDRKAGCAIR
jgi:(p)ppGpp synthase/HD superfamily hydrolase